MNKKTNEVVVVLSHLPWDFPCDYVKWTTLELAKRAKVVVFNPLYFPTLRQIIFDSHLRKKWLYPFKQKGVVYFPSLALLPFRRFGPIEKLNIVLNLLFFRFFCRLKFGRQRPIFWAFSHHLAELKDWFRWGKLLVYDRVDQIASLDPRADKTMKRADRLFLKASDYIFTNSPYALKYIKSYNKRSFLVPCGCAVSLFQKKKTNIPKEMKRIQKPIIGLVGSLDFRLDFQILYPLIKKRKDWQFVFIGTQLSHDPAQFKASDLFLWLERLQKLPNTYFLGEQPKEKMPDFIASFDVCLIPYKVSLEFVKGCNPMKLYEYLAMGKPVVSTSIEAVKIYSPPVKVASDAPGFERAIDNFLKAKDGKKEERKRKKIAQENSWKEKAKRMWQTVS